MAAILAIDPGPVESGYVVLRNGKISEHGIVPNSAIRILLSQFRLSFASESVPTEYSNSLPLVAIEMIACYGMPVGSEVFETCLWIGEFRAIMRPQPITLCYRKDIKLHLCGTTKARDPNIRQALIDRLGKPGTKKNPGPTYGVSSHAWSALAVAVYAADQAKLQKQSP
jgi:hypothetical protein